MKIVRTENGWEVTHSTHGGLTKRQRVFEDLDLSRDGTYPWEERAHSLARAFAFMASELLPTNEVGKHIKVEIMKKGE